MVLQLTGPDTASFLQGLASQDLAPGSSKRSYFLTEKGRPLALAWVHVVEDGASAWVVADDGAKETLLPHFERFRVMEDVDFQDVSGKCTVLGVASGSGAHGVAPDRAGVIRILAEPLSVLLVPSSEDCTFPTVDPAVFEPWRLAVGLARTGVDFDVSRIATELADPGAVSLTKGCYVGQEVVARTSNRGQVRRRLVGLRFDGATPLPPQAAIKSSDAVVGHVTSSAIVPGTTQGVGLAYVSSEALSLGSDLVTLQGDTTIALRIAPEAHLPS
ncbi:MAG TPA: glycine cleavage T C-terminal barrel domain-containing protein [Candidatus Eisenbacteria bacterium]|nr:glycine cleavage T C-terminal barrel domain-containing protein [Candidatus Eisenbacteria bacterium]